MRRAGGWMMGVTVVGVVVALLAACGDDGGADHNPGELYPDRANQYREDQERHIGEPVMIGGFTTTVTDATLDAEARTLRVSVEITNRNDETQRVDSTQWTLVDPTAHTLDATASTFPSPDLAGGETVTAEVSFGVNPDEAGDYYIQYKPKSLDSARGIWQFTSPVAPTVITPG